MKLLLEKDVAAPEEQVQLRLVRNGDTIDARLYKADGSGPVDSGYVVKFKIVGGKISLLRHSSVTDRYVNRESSYGRIALIDE